MTGTSDPPSSVAPLKCRHTGFDHAAFPQAAHSAVLLFVFPGRQSQHVVVDASKRLEIRRNRTESTRTIRNGSFEKRPSLST